MLWVIAGEKTEKEERRVECIGWKETLFGLCRAFNLILDNCLLVNKQSSAHYIYATHVLHLRGTVWHVFKDNFRPRINASAHLLRFIEAAISSRIIVAFIHPNDQSVGVIFCLLSIRSRPLAKKVRS